MEDALKSLLGDAVKGLYAANISRLKSIWLDEFDQWNKRDLSSKNYCYVWVDGIHFN
jgi:putative transposase